MVPNVVDLNHELRASLERSAVEVRLGSAESVPMAAEEVSRFLGELEARRADLEHLTAMTRHNAQTIMEADHFFPQDVRDGVVRLERLMRYWAPRFAALRIPEHDSIALSFARWVRPYNDAVTTLTRSLLDSARLLADRIAEEIEDDAAAAGWTQPEGDEADVVAWSDVRGRFVSGA